VSDYFGRLMRSSRLTVAPAAPASGRPRAEAAAGTPTASQPGLHDNSADVIELDIQREIEPHEPERSASPATPPAPAASAVASRIDHPRGREAPLAPTAGAASRASSEHEELVRLRRTAAEAAIRWVAADPAPQRAGEAIPGGVLRVNANDAGRASDRREASKAEAAAVLDASSVFAPAVQEGLSFAQFDIGPRENSRVGDGVSQRAPRESSGSPVEEVVEVSIGTIHVHVDGPPAKPPALGAEARGSDGRRDRSPGSALERRYLRAI
jgi:hypothetical protein